MGYDGCIGVFGWEVPQLLMQRIRSRSFKHRSRVNDPLDWLWGE